MTESPRTPGDLALLANRLIRIGSDEKSWTRNMRSKAKHWRQWVGEVRDVGLAVELRLAGDVDVVPLQPDTHAT